MVLLKKISGNVRLFRSSWQYHVNAYLYDLNHLSFYQMKLYVAILNSLQYGHKVRNCVDFEASVMNYVSKMSCNFVQMDSEVTYLGQAQLFSPLNYCVEEVGFQIAD